MKKKRNIKTTIAGIVSLLIGIVQIILTKNADAASLTSISTGIGLIAAKDGNTGETSASVDNTPDSK